MLSCRIAGISILLVQAQCAASGAAGRRFAQCHIHPAFNLN